MPQGIEVYNADGSLQFDSSNRVYRLLTVATAGAVNGSVSNAGLAEGTAVIGIESSSDSKVAPTVTVSGTTVSWNYGSTPSGVRDSGARINVAVY